MSSKRIIGLDYGKQRIGVAISDPLGSFAQPLTVLEGYSIPKVIEYLQEAHKQYAFETIVLGLPLRTKGNDHPEADAVRGIAQQIETALGLPIAFEDERYTSTIAQHALRAQGKKYTRDKGLVDQTAAALLLQSYLDKHRG